MFKPFCDLCQKEVKDPGDVREVTYRWSLVGNVGHEAKAVVDKACLKRLNSVLQETVPALKVAVDE